MADVFDAEKRSDIMRQVKSKKNKSTELKRLIEIFKQKRSPCLWTAAFGMDTTAETLALPIIKNTGRRSANGTWNTTEK